MAPVSHRSTMAPSRNVLIVLGALLSLQILLNFWWHREPQVTLSAVPRLVCVNP